MKFAYTAYDSSGLPATGTKEAASLAEAAELLRSEGLFVSEVRGAEEGQGKGGVGGMGGGGRRRIRGGRLKAVASFTRQLAVLVSTGTPVVEALAALEKQTRDETFRGIVSDVRGRVEEGESLSEALAAHPGVFDSVCRSLVEAGESGGKLEVMLKRLADLTRQQLKLRTGLIGAMVYPCLLLVVATVVLSTMLLFVLPRFTGLFTTLNVPLPPTTRALMALSESVRGYWYVYLAGLVGGGWGLAAWLRSPSGRRSMDTILIRAPQVGRLTRSLATARITRLLGVLLESRVPLLESLELTQQTCTNVHYGELIGRARDSLTRGESLSSALAASKLIEVSVCEAVRNGERSGQIGPVLLSMAEFLDEENEVVVRSLTSIVEPLILIALGIVVGLVALSMFLPLFDLTAMAGSGG